MTKLSFTTATIAVICSISVSRAQESPAAARSPAASAPAPRPDVYHVFFAHAATGKASALEDAMKKAAASGPMPGHSFDLRHEAGAPWDYVAIQHLGTNATVEATGNPQGATMRPLMDWHDDTFVNGPAWPDFAKAMGLEESGKPKSTEDVYVVSVYRPIPGQDDALDKFLAEPPSASGDLAVGTVVLQHLEGGAWRFLSISHYKNFQDYAASEVKSVADTAKGTGGWYRLRELSSFHNDTITVHTKP